MISYSQKLQAVRQTTQLAASPRTGLLGLLAATLGVPEVGLSETTPFSDLGLNSLLGVRFLDAVNRAHGLRLGVEILFAHSSIAALSAHMATLAQMPAEAAAPVVAATVAAGDIAVIGMAGRFPGAPTIAAFWRVLAEGRCEIQEVPAERWAASTFYSPELGAPGKTISKWAGFLDGIDRFDASFFNISPREAAAMDPQHRLFLEQAWLAFENAGYSLDRLKGSSTGVYVGGSGSGYEMMLKPEAKATQSYGMTGNLVSLMASRIAYFLDLRGPALVVDTACSASLVALDLACQALQRGEIGLALVGGISLFLDEKPFVAMTRTGMLSPNGRCHTFDAEANGIAVGEAVAAVVLKPLAQALADGDRIDAVIKATGTNQDGRSNGITAPNPDAQAALLRVVHRRAGIDPATITYVEAHGTGTPLGDPVEVAALRDALGPRGADAVPCAIGAVKSNIGHTAEAAGLVGLIKTVLCLQHGELVPSVNFTALNPKIDVGASGLVVVTVRQPWRTAKGVRRRAALSAFGLSGTNAHVVLEEAPQAAVLPSALGPRLLLLSAHDAQALNARSVELASWLKGEGATADLGEIAATLAIGRSHFDHRLALVVTSVAEAVERLGRGGFCAGTVARGAALKAVASADPDPDAAADLYLQGADPVWPHLWPMGRPCLPLPGYPFAPTVHWAARRPAAAVPAHPFADSDTDRVSRRFTVGDPVVRDHVIGGVAVLHAAVFLEMARLAAERAAGQPVRGLRSVAWAQTVTVPVNGITIRIDTAAVEGRVTCAMIAGEAIQAAARCEAVFHAAEPVARIDIAGIKALAERHADHSTLKRMDRGAVHLGRSFAGLEELWLGVDVALARIGPVIAECGCLWPPHLMDAAIQTGAALLAKDDGAQMRLRYPAHVAAIDILDAPPLSGCFILARLNGTDRVDLTITDPEGIVRLHWSGFEMRAASVRPVAMESATPKTYAPLWIERDVAATSAASPDAIIGDIVCVDPVLHADRPEDLESLVAVLAPDARIVFADLGGGRSALLLRLATLLAARGLATSPLELRVVTANVHRVTGRETALNPDAAAVQGLAKAIGREFPTWRMVILDIDAAEIGADLRGLLLGASPAASGEPVALREGIRFERVLEPVEALPVGKVLRAGGAYLLVGGMGRVGQEIARHLASRFGARLMLVGRKPLDAAREEVLAGLRRLGAEVDYRAVDITEPGALTPVVAAMKARFGAVHGVMQAVVDPLFARLDRTDAADFAAALRPKIAGLREVARATAAETLDFLAVFSSIGAYASFPGNVGQASYCAACCFEEAFAAELHAAGRPVRLVQWGLWDNEAFAGEGLTRLRRQGTYPMRTADAVLAFEGILSGSHWSVVQASLSEGVWQAMGAEASPTPEFTAAATALHAYGKTAEAVDATLHQAVDAYARLLTMRVLRERGLMPPLGSAWSAADLRRRFAVLPRHDRLFEAVLELVGRDTSDAPTREALLTRGPSLREPLELLELCVAALPDVINGEREGTDVLFPGGSMHLVEAIYSNQPVLKACSAMLACAAAASRSPRILEVGAGTGSTTGAVLAALGEAPYEYHYTDISAAFVRHARARFADPRMHFAVLDIERDPSAQSIDTGSFDLVLATNVLHATRDMGETLRHIATLLRPGGLVLINEMTVAEDFATLTFGLLGGWWRAADPARRLPHSPLLDVPRWRQALRAAGLEQITAAPAPGFADPLTSPQVVLLGGKALAQAITPTTPFAVKATASGATATVGAIEGFVQARVAAGLDMTPGDMDPETPFGDMGVDSIVAPQIAEDINRAVGITLRSTDLYNFSTIRSLAAHIAARFPDARFGGDDFTSKPEVSVPAIASTPGPDMETDHGIAIIGMAGRFPDAPDLNSFWLNIAAGRSAVREIDRFDLTPHLAAEDGKPAKTYARWAAMLDDHDRFDPLFFAISPAEAEAMDPQQRLLLEEAWHALEDAGATARHLNGARCGVFVGASANSYIAPASPSLQTLGGSMAILSARLSYFLNLKGPTFPIDTGCSSSLVALHLACQSLRCGETDMAIAAGVSCNLLSPPIFVYLSDAGMASAEGRCKTFDDSADGFVPGEGVGVIVLKRLADALRDGDRIHAVVRGTGVNQDGKTSGLTAPSATSQTELECAVYRQAGIDPLTIGLVEAHGTGTRLGDPIEVSALTDAFAAFTPRKNFCAIGSVKTNIGHAMAAAGMAGLLKAVQALRHRTLPASLNFSTPNRHIDFANSPFVVNTETRPWTSDQPRRAAVSSFGFSGTNAHVVLEEAPPMRADEVALGPFLFVISAKTEASLIRRVDNLREWLHAAPDVMAGDVAYTLAVRRTHFRFRRSFVATSLLEFAAALDSTGRVAIPEDLGALAARYAAGETVDFDFMKGRIVDLPGYSFERERYWNPETAQPTLARSGLPSFARSWLTQDHVIQGRRLLPGAAFLEFARAATQNGQAGCIIRDVVWSTPIDVTDGDPGVTLDLEPVGIAIRCTLRAAKTVYATGLVTALVSGNSAVIDLASIISRCPTRLEGSAVYEAGSRHGFAYGPSYRVINDVAIGTDEAIARLMPQGGGGEGWLLHPALLDGAFQTAACIGLGRADRAQPTYVPFGIEAFEAYAPLRGPCHVHAKLTGSSAALFTFDIAVYGDDGAVLAICRGLQARVLADAQTVQTLISVPAWRPEPARSLPQAALPAVLAFASDGHVAVLRATLPGQRVVQIRAAEAFARFPDGGFAIDPLRPEDYRRLLVEASPGPNAVLAHLWALDVDVTEDAVSSIARTIEALDPDTGLRSLFLAAQAALQAPDTGIARVVFGARPGPGSAAAAGFARTVNLESSRLTCMAIALEPADLPLLASEFSAVPEAELTYCKGARLVRRLDPSGAPTGLAPAGGGVVITGVVVITGGAGAIGLGVARHLAGRGQPKLILIGRSALNAAQQTALGEIEAAGADVLYLIADVTSGAALRAALDKGRRRFGPITGVIHAAGILRDGRILQNELALFDAVTAPKVMGAITLDHLTREDPLAFFLLFSSTAATFGSAGQAGYAAANGFLEGFAEWRGTQARPGRSVAVSWPLWQSSGMTPPPDVVAEIDRKMGMLPMPQAAGLAALDQALGATTPRLVVLHGRATALNAFIAGAQPVAETRAPAAMDLQAEVEAYLKTVIAEVTKLAPGRIDSQERFEAYGIDSMMIVRMNTQLEQDIGDLPKTLFFEYQTVRDLATCLVTDHAAVLAKRFSKVPEVFAIAARAPHSVATVDDGAIAIIGISGLYPMAADLDQFWRNLASGRDCIVDIPEDRWSLEGFYDPDRDRPETSYSKWGGFIDGVANFDARFFNISPREADALDPQTRKFLEVAWATMEDAGLTRDTLFRGDAEPAQRLAGVFVGVMYGDYQLFGPEEAARGHLIAPNAAYWNVANRVSHFLDLHGPSMAVDTACSSSLSAIHVACAALRNGDCTIAFAGGVNLTVHPNKHWILSKSGFASSDGRCRSFGDGGDGYVPGEGVGAVLLKPLARALADGDRVHAVIRASAVNHGGRTNGYTVPNPVAQGSLVASALRRGGIAAESISYIEAHGTGTSLGDPVEIAGLSRAFAGLPIQSLPIGSVKSNIGHLESAAGIAALTKVVLQFRHGALAPSLHSVTLNANLNLGATPFYVQQELANWPRHGGQMRRAGISSFGAGGANAHLVVEEPPETPIEPGHDGTMLIVPLSAATPEALTEQATRLADWLSGPGQAVDFAAVVRSLQVGREVMRHRLAVSAATPADLIVQLRAFAECGRPSPSDAVTAGWLVGGSLDWAAQAPGPRRPVSVPTYPFARRRCWVELTDRTPVAPVAQMGMAQPIRCALDDTLVTDHRFGNDIVLAGAYLLEAARLAGGGASSGVSDIQFLRPVKPEMAPTITVQGNGRFVIQVGETLHADGCLLTQTPPAPPPLDLAAIESRCAERVENDAIYAALAAGGAQYGPAYRLLDRVWRGEGEALAELVQLPAGEGWPPNLLDAVFQITFALTQEGGGLAPFTIDRIAMTGPLTAATHAYGLRRESGRGFVRLDLRLTDAEGMVLMSVDGFVARVMPTTLPLRLLRPVWAPAPRRSAMVTGRALILGDTGLAIALSNAWPEGNATVVAALPDEITADSIWFIDDRNGRGDEADAVIRLANVVSHLAAQPRPPSLTVVIWGANAVLPNEEPNPSGAAVAAFAKSVAREHPEFQLRVIDIDAVTVGRDLLSLPLDAGEIAWRRGSRWTKHLTGVSLAVPTKAWRTGGTYLIAGGAGGIGLALAEHLVRSAGARVAILGRRPLDAALSATIDRIDGDVVYLQADVTDALALEEAVRLITARFGNIHGAFHLALSMHDARAVTLTAAQIRTVLAPKVSGTRNLMASLRDVQLDFLMLFSSSNAHTTNPGQSAYAAASAAQDAIGLMPASWPVKIADWGFWGEVGRVAAPEYHASLARIGVYPIGTAEGFDTVARIIASSFPQIMPLRISEDVAKALGIAARGAVEAAADAVALRAATGASMLDEAMQSFAAIDGYAANLLLLALQGIGALDQPGERVGTDFATRFAILPRFAPLQAALLDILCRGGFLSRIGDDWVVTDEAAGGEAPRRAALALQRANWVVAQPEVVPYLNLLDACCARVGDVLRGTVDANDVLFPGGSTALVEPIYRGNQVVDHFQSIVAEATVAAVRQKLEALGSGQTLRILEIGAGTGSTTAFVLAALVPYASRISFVFTDVGRIFLDAAPARFAEYPFLSVEYLDIEKSPMAQGFAANSFDLVIAANVLHATRDIETTVAHVASLCREGGLLLVNEATARQDFNTLTFGLTRGWWLFQDAERRIPHTPLLDATAWRSVLAGHGFRATQVLAGGEGALQSIFAAAGNGAAVVVEKVARTAAPVIGGELKIEELLRITVARSLRLAPEEVEPETSFADYGADSIISVELVRDINAALGIELKTTALFNYATVRTLAGYIATEFASQLAVGAEAAPKPVSRARVRTERLRDMIRRSRNAIVTPETVSQPKADPVLDDDTAFLTLLKRLQAGEINVADALAETGYD